MEGLGIEEKIGVMCSPLGKCFKDNSLRAVGNKEKSHTCALDSRPTGIGMEDSGREVRPPSHTPHDIQKKKKALWERLALPLTSFPMLLPGSQHCHLCICIYINASIGNIHCCFVPDFDLPMGEVLNIFIRSFSAPATLNQLATN